MNNRLKKFTGAVAITLMSCVGTFSATAAPNAAEATEYTQNQADLAVWSTRVEDLIETVKLNAPTAKLPNDILTNPNLADLRFYILAILDQEIIADPQPLIRHYQNNAISEGSDRDLRLSQLFDQMSSMELLTPYDASRLPEILALYRDDPDPLVRLYTNFISVGFVPEHKVNADVDVDLAYLIPPKGHSEHNESLRIASLVRASIAVVRGDLNQNWQSILAATYYFQQEGRPVLIVTHVQNLIASITLSYDTTALYSLSARMIEMDYASPAMKEAAAHLHNYNTRYTYSYEQQFQALQPYYNIGFEHPQLGTHAKVSMIWLMFLTNRQDQLGPLLQDPEIKRLRNNGAANSINALIDLIENKTTAAKAIGQIRAASVRRRSAPQIPSGARAYTPRDGRFVLNGGTSMAASSDRISAISLLQTDSLLLSDSDRTQIDDIIASMKANNILPNRAKPRSTELQSLISGTPKVVSSNNEYIPLYQRIKTGSYAVQSLNTKKFPSYDPQAANDPARILRNLHERDPQNAWNKFGLLAASYETKTLLDARENVQFLEVQAHLNFVENNPRQLLDTIHELAELATTKRERIDSSIYTAMLAISLEDNKYYDAALTLTEAWKSFESETDASTIYPRLTQSSALSAIGRTYEARTTLMDAKGLIRNDQEERLYLTARLNLADETTETGELETLRNEGYNALQFSNVPFAISELRPALARVSFLSSRAANGPEQQRLLNVYIRSLNEAAQFKRQLPEETADARADNEQLIRNATSVRLRTARDDLNKLRRFSVTASLIAGFLFILTLFGIAYAIRTRNHNNSAFIQRTKRQRLLNRSLKDAQTNLTRFSVRMDRLVERLKRNSDNLRLTETIDECSEELDLFSKDQTRLTYITRTNLNVTPLIEEKILVEPLTNRIHQYWNRQIQGTEVDLIIKLDNPTLVLRTDLHLLNTAISECLDIAIEHTQSGSICLTISTDREPGSVAIQVSDTGDGKQNIKIDYALTTQIVDRLSGKVSFPVIDDYRWSIKFALPILSGSVQGEIVKPSYGPLHIVMNDR